jgi:ribose/xylose/arabinose/galactoside ABC-type transport system permease subunit
VSTQLDTAPGVGPAAARQGRLDGWRQAFGASPATPVFAALAVVFIVAWIVVTAHGESFLSIDNIVGMLQRSVALGIVAIGQTLAILVGSLDLSVAQVISLASLVAATTMDGDPNKVAIGIAATLGMGVVVGLANGLIITKLRVNAFIATLGMGLILQGYIESRWDGPSGAVPDNFQALGYTRFGPIPESVILLAVVLAAAWFALRFTRFGHRLYAVGGDEDVSRLSGLRTHRTIIGAHVLCSMLAALTGLFLASRLATGTPVVGSSGGYDLESIAAVVLGGTALAGGRGGVLGTIGGVFLLAVVDNAFDQLEVNSFLKDVVRGLILVAAVAAYARHTVRRGEHVS